MMNDDTVGALLIGGGKGGVRPPMALPVIDSNSAPILSSKIFIENQLAPYPDHLTPLHGGWQNVNGTRYGFYNRKLIKTFQVVQIINLNKTNLITHI